MSGVTFPIVCFLASLLSVSPLLPHKETGLLGAPELSLTDTISQTSLVGACANKQQNYGLYIFTEQKVIPILVAQRVQPVEDEKLQAERQRLDDQARVDRERLSNLLVFWFLIGTLIVVLGVVLLFYLVLRSQSSKATRLEQTSLKELWSLPHLSKLAPSAYHLWILSPPKNSFSNYWTLRSGQDGTVFGLTVFGRRKAEWEGNCPKIHFRHTQDLHRVSGPIEVSIDGGQTVFIKRTQPLGLGCYEFTWGGEDYQISFESKKDRIELTRNGTSYAISDFPLLKLSPRVIAVPKDQDIALLLIFSYILLIE